MNVLMIMVIIDSKLACNIDIYNINFYGGECNKRWFGRVGCE